MRGPEEARGRECIAQGSKLIFALLLMCAACCGAVIRGAPPEQSLDEKLGAATDYIPKAAAPLDRLVEVAREFKIPMAVEWLERGGEIAPGKTMLATKKRSVRELIEEIAGRSPEHRVEIEGGLVRVYAAAAAEHPFNFLNIRLQNYSVDHADLFAAEDQLRWAIRFTLNPARYGKGYGGGYGHGSPEVFEFPKFSLAATDITIRSVLNRIVEAQGNAMWVVTLAEAELDGRQQQQPHWKGKDPDAGHTPLTSRWRFFPLSEIAELAREQLIVHVRVAGLLDKRMTRIPLILEHGLHADEGGATGGADDGGTTYFYAARIEKIEQDAVTLSVELKVKRAGEAEQKFKKKLRVTRHAPLEVWPFPHTEIRASIEPRG